LGSFFIYFIRVLARVGEDGYFVADDLHITTGNSQVGIGPFLTHQYLPGLKDGHKRRMMGQNPQLSVHTRSYNHVHLILIDLALRGDYF
jgi:hypothetical protein